jgi:hypothetical protein
MEELRAAMTQTPSSSAGMDGIPYHAYFKKPSSTENLEWLSEDWKLIRTAGNPERECSSLGVKSKKRAKERKQEDSPTA